ncbi:MAG TPA: hypothetical protein VLH83_06655 [Chthoniobacterales bacterium]|nr:hypothetical protein [Chthoniobacterales bacterium]
MRLLSQQTPPPRLLNTVVPEVHEKTPERIGMRSRIRGVSLFAGNGRAIFLGIALGAALLCTVGVLYARHLAARRHAEEERQLLAVSTQSISPPQPIVINISADLIHVTAISLGHPRLAIINGQQLGEGEQITIHTPAASIAVTLRVLKISDGRIDLSDGTQTISARLEMPSIVHPKL